MMHGLYLTFATLIFLFYPSANAGPISYICTITEFSMYGDEDREWTAKRAMEQTIAVDRRTGAVIHPVIATSEYHNVRVLNFGDDNWSFKLFADSGEGQHTIYIEVREFYEGEKKPFVAVQDGIAYTGFCM
jgi:hypothetical protein